MAFLQVDEISESQAGKYVTHNAAVRKLRILSQIIVKDRNLTAPPGAPTNGDTYIPAATATGAWAGYENRIVFYSGTSWVSLTAAEGWMAYLQDENIFIVYNGSSWVNFQGGVVATSVNGFDEDNFVLRDEYDNVFIGSQSSASPSAVEGTNTLHIEVGIPPTAMSDHVQVYADYASSAMGSAEGVVLCIQNEDGTAVKLYQGPAVADATDAPSVIARLNELLGHLRLMGIIATS